MSIYSKLENIFDAICGEAKSNRKNSSDKYSETKGSDDTINRALDKNYTPPRASHIDKEK